MMPQTTQKPRRWSKVGKGNKYLEVKWILAKNGRERDEGGKERSPGFLKLGT